MKKIKKVFSIFMCAMMVMVFMMEPLESNAASSWIYKYINESNVSDAWSIFYHDEGSISCEYEITPSSYYPIFDAKFILWESEIGEEGWHKVEQRTIDIQYPNTCKGTLFFNKNRKYKNNVFKITFECEKRVSKIYARIQVYGS
jgi:hypothetical protein